MSFNISNCSNILQNTFFQFHSAYLKVLDILKCCPFLFVHTSRQRLIWSNLLSAASKHTNLSWWYGETITTVSAQCNIPDLTKASWIYASQPLSRIISTTLSFYSFSFYWLSLFLSVSLSPSLSLDQFQHGSLAFSTFVSKESQEGNFVLQ